MLGIDPALIEKEGAVSEACAREMARGALEKSRAGKKGADFAASATGLAGPDGDDRGTPVGTVWIGLAAWKNGGAELEARRFLFRGGRQAVREQAALKALELLLTQVV
jgi:nicotinamide-nucleotide amidase